MPYTQILIGNTSKTMLLFNYDDKFCKRVPKTKDISDILRVHREYKPKFQKKALAFKKRDFNFSDRSYLPDSASSVLHEVSVRYRRGRYKVPNFSVPVLTRQPAIETILEEPQACECVLDSSLIYCDYVNILASEDKSSLDISNFLVNFRKLQSMKCECECKSYVISLVSKDVSIMPQGFSSVVSSLLGSNAAGSEDYVDEKIEKVRVVLNHAASNVKHSFTDETKDYIDMKFAHLEGLASDAKVKLTIPDVTGLGGILSRMFNEENVSTSVMVMFSILYLSRKYHPSLGDICALFAGMAMCYVGSKVVLPILLTWLNPTPQSAGEWITVITEILGISLFAAKGRWSLDLSSIISNFVAIEKEKPMLEQLVERIQNLIFSIIRLIAEALGKEWISDFSPMAERIRHLRKRVRLINADPSSNRTPSIQYIKDVTKLSDDIMDLYEDVSVTKGNDRYVNQINSLIMTIRPLVDYLSANNFISGSRFSSFVRTLVGFTGVGKTAIAEELNRALFNEFATEDMKLAAGGDYSKICYPVQSGQKFFESYNSQMITQLNDYLQKREKMGDEFSPTEFIIQAGGNSVCKLKCAGVNKKDKVDYSSLCLDISTNEYCLNTLTCPTVSSAIPINRRIAGINNTGFPCIMAVNERYGMTIELPPGTVFPTPPEGKPKNYFTLTVDMTKVPLKADGIEKDFTNVYEFYDWSFTTGQLLADYRKYTLAEYKTEFIRRFRIHYNNQINYLRGAARRGEVCTSNLPVNIVAQGKTRGRDAMEELFRSDNESEDDYETCNYDDARTVASDRLNFIDEEEESDMIDLGSSRTARGLLPYSSSAPVLMAANIAESELLKGYADEPKTAVVEVMQQFIQEGEGLTMGILPIADPREFKLQKATKDLDERGLDIKQANSIKGWSRDEMKVFIRSRFTDPMILAVKKVMRIGLNFKIACKIVSTSLLEVTLAKTDKFMLDPLLWFKSHPFVAGATIGVTGLAVYATISLTLKLFRGLVNRKEVDPHEEGVKSYYIQHLKNGKNHSTECCSTEAIREAYFKHLHLPQAIPMAEVVEQQSKGSIPGDRKWQYANASLENFYTFWARYTYCNPDGSEYVKVVDEVKCLALEGHLFSLHFHILRDIISTSRLKHCLKVEVGITPVVTSSFPQCWYEYKTLRWIIRANSAQRDEVFFQMPAATKIHGSAVSRMPVRDPEYLKILQNGRFPVKFFRSVGRTTGMDANLRIGEFTYPLARSVPGTDLKDLLPEAEAEYDGYQIDIETLSGDCGAPCFAWTKAFTHLVSKNSVFQHPFIMYRHSAWHNLLSYGFGLAYYQEDYDWIKPYVLAVKVKTKAVSVESNIETMVAIANEVSGQSKSCIPFIRTPFVEAPIAEHHIPIGSIDEVKINRHNSIARSELFPFVKQRYGISKMPTKLYATPEGDPLILGIQGYGGNQQVPVNPVEVDIVTDFIVSSFINDSSEITDDLRERIPIKEAIQGSEGLKGLNRKSGIGPSLTHMCKSMDWSPQDFKESFGTEGDYDFDNPMSQTFVKIAEKAMSEACQGVAPTVLFQHHLKQECKEGPKVRLFHGADKTSVPMFISAYGGMIKWILKNRVKNGLLIGVNPAKDWPIVWSHLTSVGQYGLPGDFGKYDKFQLWMLLNITYRLAQAFYGLHDPEGNVCREALFECLKNPMFVLALGDKSCVYAWQHGNCSGNVLTTIINCLSNIGIIYFCMLKILRSYPEFSRKDIHDILQYIKKNIRFVIMGDDHIITMTYELRQFVNFYNYQQAVYDLFHMEYTDDHKGKRIGFVIPLHTHILECTILGRGFQMVDGQVCAPLRDTSMLECLAWYKGKVHDKFALVLMVERTLAELSAHGRKRFSLESRDLCEACYKYTDIYPTKNLTFSAAFSAYKSLKFSEYNVYSEGDEQENDFEPVLEMVPHAYLNELDVSIQSVSKQFSDGVKKTSSKVDIPPEVDGALCVMEEKHDTRKPIITLQSKSGEDMVDGGLRVNDQLLNVVSTDKHETTEFVEGESKVLSTEVNNVTRSDLEVRGESIKDFLHKPYLLQTIQWASTLAIDANLYTVDIGPLLDSVVIWQRKAEGYELFRGTFNIRVQINADPFMQGRALLHYIPNYTDRIAIEPKFGNRYNYKMIQKFQHPHIELDIHDTVAEMSIPYVAPSAWYDRKSGTYDWGRVWLDVVSPLEVGAAAANKNAEISIFGFWTDVELAAAIVPQAKSRGSFKATKDLAKIEDSSKVSNGLNAVASAADSLSSIPVLAPAMGAVSWASRTMSSLASVFGWSKPYIEDKQTIVTQQNMRYAGCSTGPDTSVCSALLHDNKTEVTDEYTIRAQDEMSLKFLLSVPTYMGPTTWTTAHASNTLLISQVIRPQNFNFSSLQAGTIQAQNYSIGAPLFYLSNFFGYYRGSIDVTLKIVKTIFQTGKLLITFTPISTVTVIPDTSTSVYSLRTIVDIREQSVIKLNLPYLLHKTYCNQSEAIGTLHVRVLNDLRAPETCAQQVQILTFYTAGEDFEYQVPSNSNIYGAGIYTPQSKSSAETLVDAGIGASEVKSATTMYSSTCMGEHFTSIKQLLSRNCQLQPLAARTYPGNNYRLYPYFTTGYTSVPITGLLVPQNYAADAFSFFAPMFAYFRGSSRVYVSGSGGNRLLSGLDPMFFKYYSTAEYLLDVTSISSFGLNRTVTSTVGNDKNAVNSIQPSSETVPNMVFQQGTYQNKYPVSFVHVWQSENIDFMNKETTPATAIAIVNADGASIGSTTTIWRSFTDEFQLSFFIACPPVYNSTSVLVGAVEDGDPHGDWNLMHDIETNPGPVTCEFHGRFIHSWVTDSKRAARYLAHHAHLFEELKVMYNQENIDIPVRRFYLSARFLEHFSMFNNDYIIGLLMRRFDDRDLINRMIWPDEFHDNYSLIHDIETNPGFITAAFEGKKLKCWIASDKESQLYFTEHRSGFEILSASYNSLEFDPKVFYNLGKLISNQKIFHKCYLHYLISKKIPDSEDLIKELCSNDV